MDYKTRRRWRQVQGLTSAADPAARDNAIPAIRQLIDRIILTPGKGERDVEIEVEGRLAAIVALAGGKPMKPTGKGNRKTIHFSQYSKKFSP